MTDLAQIAGVVELKRLDVVKRIVETILPELQKLSVIGNGDIGARLHQQVDRLRRVNDVGVTDNAIVRAEPLIGAKERRHHLSFIPNVIVEVLQRRVTLLNFVGTIAGNDGDIVNAGFFYCVQLPIEQRIIPKARQTFRQHVGFVLHSTAAPRR